MASPEASDNTNNRDHATMTGGGFFMTMIPPIETVTGPLTGRDTTNWKVAPAADTGCGGAAESMARTVTGLNAPPAAMA